MDLTTITEGGKKYNVPLLDPRDIVPRKNDEVFFNVYQDINRDFSVLLIRAYSKMHEKEKLRICEPFGGVGVRTCRYVTETPAIKVFYNDNNPNAINIAKLNSEALSPSLKQKIIFHNDDVTDFLNFLYSKKEIMDIMDVDPYGTPIPYVHNSLKLVTNQGLIALTATDLASLAGVYPKAMYAKYGIGLFESRIGNIHELAVRILITGIQRIGLIQNQSLIPILSLYHRHYIRIFLARRRGVKEVLENTGFLCQCKECRTIFLTKMSAKKTHCIECEGLKLNRTGPIYLGSIHQVNYLKKMKNDSHLLQFTRQKTVSRLLNAMIEESELNLPWSYDISLLAKEIKSPIPRMDLIAEKLEELGFKCKKTHFSGICVKTDAKVSYLEKILEEYGKNRRV